MIRELIGKSGAFIVKIENVFGSGWDDDIQKIIEKQLKPIKLSKRIIEQTWDYSEKEFDLEKDSIVFIFHLDDDTSSYFSLKKENITEGSKQKLREWAMIVAQEAEKLR